jgi:hypothetical protein
VTTPPQKGRQKATLAERAAQKAQKRGRALDRANYVASRRGVFDPQKLDEALTRYLADAAPSRTARGPRALPTSNVQRWVPLGPSVVRRGQAEGSPRVTGRVRDLAVSPDGTRAYAATAKGGVWYTGDGGATWDPVGGWADRPSQGGNNAQACGCVLVAFGAGAPLDFVMVGTGEIVPSGPAAHWHSGGGVGVLAARGPVAAGVGAQPWELDSGIAQFASLAMFRLARHPAATAGSNAGATADRVVAATSTGLFLGTRSSLPAPPSVRDGFTWTRVAALDAFVGSVRPITDAIWLPGGANGRLVVAVDSMGVAFSDNLGAAWTWVTGLSGLIAPLPAGRMSLAHATGTRIYVLGDLGGSATVWQIPSASVPAPAATVVPGTPAGLFGTQRDYDQAIAVDSVGATDRVYLGGSTVQAAAGGNWSAALWCFDTPAPPAAAALAPSPTLSSLGAPPAGAGADQAGLIGNNVHADVHAIRLAGAAGPTRQVWVATAAFSFRRRPDV